MCMKQIAMNGATGPHNDKKMTVWRLARNRTNGGKRRERDGRGQPAELYVGNRPGLVSYLS